MVSAQNKWIFINVCVYACMCEVKVAQSCLTLLQPHGLYSPWNSPDQNTGVGSFSRGSSQPRDQTQVSRITGRFFTS